MLSGLIPRASRWCLSSGAAVVIGGCASADRPPVEAVTRDSAGIAIVENAAVSSRVAAGETKEKGKS